MMTPHTPNLCHVESALFSCRDFQTQEFGVDFFDVRSFENFVKARSLSVWSKSLRMMPVQMQHLKLFEVGAIWKNNMRSTYGCPYSVVVLKHVGVPVLQSLSLTFGAFYAVTLRILRQHSDSSEASWQREFIQASDGT